MIAQLWRDHSLTVVTMTIGAGLSAGAFVFEDDRMWDLVLGLGQGTLTAGLVFYLSRYFREVAKPEDPPE